MAVPGGINFSEGSNYFRKFSSRGTAGVYLHCGV